MKRLQTIAISTATLLMLVLLPAAGAHAASPTGEIRSGVSERVDAWVTQRMAAHGTPGAAVAVVRGGEVVHLAGYGTADGRDRPVTPDTPFIIGSASKPFTAALVGQLVGEGLLEWDEPVWPYLSRIIDDPPEGFETATVEQLVTHTGGLGMMNGTAGTSALRHATPTNSPPPPGLPGKA